MNFGRIWDLIFNSFVVFIGVGIVWLRFVEPLFPSQTLSVIAMVVVALAAAVVRFTLGYRNTRRQLLEAEAQIEASRLQYQEVVE